MTNTQVVDDLKEIRAWVAADPEVEARVKALEERNLWRTALAVGAGYVGFALSFYLIISVDTWWANLLAVIIIGNRLQSFENLLHEAGHGNLANSRKLNDWIADYLLAIPIFKSFPLYRPMHLAHHNHLGDPEQDPDYIGPPKPGESSVSIFLKKFFSRIFIRHALIGEIIRCSWLARLKILVVFSAVGGLLWFLTDGRTVLEVAMWWWVARLTVYHLLMVFQELSDHQGLDPGGIFSFSRNAPLGFMAHVFHPHNSGLHLLHHLRPKIPFFNLPKADRIFLELPRYEEATRCKSYLFGLESVVKSWQRNDQNPGAGTV
ncbi:MAG: fatty acid desaturase family protein [Verrucomicrobiales bacterium]|nr:fatty acid desaturase family protein [Verrucomicrobiales bacterium]